MKTNQHQISNLSTIGLLSLVMLITAALMSSLAVMAGPATQPMAGPAALVLTGSYSGNVTVKEPVPLGALELVLNITDTKSALSGQVDAAKTQVFLGGPTFTGIVTASQAITPTFRIDSAVFTGLVSGRQVQRQFTLAGEIWDGGDTLRGQYTETITGFRPKPLLVKGDLLLVRPNGSQVFPPNPDLPTATATATATATSTPRTPTATATATRTSGPGGSTSSSVYMPVIVNKGAAVNSAGAATSQLDNVPIVEPTATPQPTSTAPAVAPATTPMPASSGKTNYLPVMEN
jgi:hypothetical protein